MGYSQIFSYPPDVLVQQAQFIQRVDSTIDQINNYPLDNSIGYDSTYPAYSDLFAG